MTKYERVWRRNKVFVRDGPQTDPVDDVLDALELAKDVAELFLETAAGEASPVGPFMLLVDLAQMQAKFISGVVNPEGWRDAGWGPWRAGRLKTHSPAQEADVYVGKSRVPCDGKKVGSKSRCEQLAAAAEKPKPRR